MRKTLFSARSRRTRLLALMMSGSALALTLPAAAMAQDNTSAATQLPEISVQSHRDDDENSIAASSVALGGKLQTEILDTPASVSVITAKEIQDRAAQTIEQVLQYTPGVATDFYGSDDRFDYMLIRGFDAYTFRDGLTMGKAFGNLREEPLAYERVEVLRGADSTVFGLSAPGGAVNYVTRTPNFVNSTDVSTTLGSYSHADVGFDINRVLDKNQTLAVRLTGKLQSSDAEYDYSQDDERFIQGGVTWAPSDRTKVSFVFDYLDRNSTPGSGGQPIGTDFDRSKYFGEPGINHRNTNRASYTLLAEHEFGGGLKASSTTRYSDTRTDFGYVYLQDNSPTSDGSADRFAFANAVNGESFNTNAQLQYDTYLGSVKSRTLAGLEYAHDSADNYGWWLPAAPIDIYNPVYSGMTLDGVGPSTGTRTQHTTKSGYVKQEFTFDERWIASFGARHDDIETTSTNLMSGYLSPKNRASGMTYSAALTYKITPDLSAYASYVQSMVPGSATALEPEKGEQYELGVKYRPAGSNALLSAAVYDLTRDNLTRTNPATLQLETIGKIRAKGLDLEARGDLTDTISLVAGYSYIDSKIVENGTAGNEGNAVGFVSPHTASLWANYKLAGNGSRGDATFGLGVRYTGSYFMTDANTVKASDATLFDAAASYALTESTQLQLNVSNLFDEKHITYDAYGATFYNPGRTASLTLRHRF